MNILVTGAGGFIGGRVAERLSDRHKVYGLLHDRWPDYVPFEPVLGDVDDYARMLEILVNFEIDQVYHYAARPIVRNCVLDPIGCFQTNVVGTVTVLEAARQQGNVQGILCMESDKSYGHATPPYHEDQVPVPEGIYEASKACVGYIVKAYHRNYGLPVFSVRAANVYGPGDMNMTRLVPRTITRMLAEEAPQIVDGAEHFLREFLYVDDLVDFSLALMRSGPWGQTVNVGSGVVLSVGDMVDRICAIMEYRGVRETWARPATMSEIPSQALCCELLHSLVGNNRPLRTIDDGLRETIDWYRRFASCPS